MAKIGRNEKCPCGSGRKFKHCCALNPLAQQREPTAEEQLKVSLMGAVDKILCAAEQNKPLIKELGVFVLFSTNKGNGWLFEATQSDCLQLVKDGKKMPIPIDENPQTIEIEWSHTFAVVDRQMELTAYENRKRQVLEDCPVHELSAAVRRIRKKVPASMLKEIHLDSEKA